MAILSCIIVLKKNNYIKASTKANGISSFPASYQIYLKELQNKHSNWTFTALNTNLDWNNAVKSEGANGGFIDSIKKSAVPLSFADVWKWKNNNGSYNEIEPRMGYSF